MIFGAITMKGYIKGDTIVLLEKLPEDFKEGEAVEVEVISLVHRNLNAESVQAIDELKASDRLTVYESFAELRHDLGV